MWIMIPNSPLKLGDHWLDGAYRKREAMLVSHWRFFDRNLNMFLVKTDWYI